MKMPFIAALSLSLCFSTSSYAGIEACDFRTSYDFSLENEAVTVKEQDKIRFTITKDNLLMVGGETHPASQEHKALLQGYKESTSKFFQDVTTLALEGAEFGSQVALDVVGALFQNTSAEAEKFKQSLIQSMRSLRDQLESNTTWNDAFIESVFENQFEQNIESAAESFAQSIEENITEHLFSFSFWKNISTIESRMEAFEQEIEVRAQAFEKNMEVKGQSLCQSLQVIDDIETQFLHHYPDATWFNSIEKQKSSDSEKVSISLL